MTVLSSDDYLPGSVILHDSLVRVGSRYPLYVLVGRAVSPSVTAALGSAGIDCLPLPASAGLPEDVRTVNARNDRDHWTRTLEKLSVFSLAQFAKVVYVDSDMLVVKNIDHLFERPHMSAVAAGVRVPGNEDWVTLNSGLMVIEPDPEAYARLPELIPATAHRRLVVEGALGLGDQDVITEAHPEWRHTRELRLPDGYNMFTDYLDLHIRQLGVSWSGAEGVHVLHFVGHQKPWMVSTARRLRWCAWALSRHRWYECLVVAMYSSRLAQVRHRYRHTGLGALLGSRTHARGHLWASVLARRRTTDDGSRPVRGPVSPVSPSPRRMGGGTPVRRVVRRSHGRH
ncbi:glycosyl transferase family 8 [Geodermatophilus tzadiensis]|uniref:Glycosyl transferase family 8 n=1 Tax=Geodermatophilus tzadiensis TaxID=1137988 RepID=A0A2T0TR29_9ACTN|nr:glycosyl transferase family 8 [Geodermatophilus tzadiensis]